jgi:hypothetical protein
MGSVKLHMSENLRIKWPNQCAVCNNPPADSSKTSITNTIKFRYYVVAMSFTHQTYTLLYPVCKKHKRLCNLLDQPARSSLLNNTFAFFIAATIFWLILDFIITYTVGFIGLKNISEDAILKWSGYLAFGLVIGFIIYGIYIKPVKVISLSENSMKINIKNDKYLNEFNALNMNNIIR